MIRFRTPGPIGPAEIGAMAAVIALTAKTQTTHIPDDMARQLRVLGITVELPPSAPPAVAVPVEGRVS